jgi:enoyl-CoA hydratase/carnithine racemase
MNNFKGETLSWDQKDGIIELALHRPPANEIGPATLAELQKFVAALESDLSGASALIIYSQLNSGFSAGGNLRELYAYAQRATPAQRAADIRVLIELSHGLFNAIDAAPVVTIAAVHGICFGGGFELALTSDLIIADKMARFCFPELRLGLIPGGGGIPRLKRDLRNGIVRDLILTGRSMNADRAFSAGLVSQVTAPGEALTVARITAAQITKVDAVARIAAKKFIKWIPDDELRHEIDIFCELFSRPAVIDGLRKYVESTNVMPYLP